MITGVILAHNEEHHIVDCITALRPHVGEVLLIDTESTDRTIELARPLVNRVLSHPNVPNFDSIRNIAIPEGQFDWLWFVDADERIPTRTGRLVNELIQTRGSEFEAINIPFKSHFCGQWMQHCGWWPGYTVCRVVKRGHFEFGKNLHSGVYLRGRELRFPPDPELAIPHFSSRSLEHYVAKFNRYTSTEALQLNDANVRYDWKSAVSMMMRDLWEHYELHNAREDGSLGWILTWMAGQYRWLSHSKLIDLQDRKDDSFPSSLDEVFEVMQDELAVFRSRIPQAPLGVVYHAPEELGEADAARLVESAVLLAGNRQVRIEPGCVDALRAVCGDDWLLIKALANANRPRYSVGIHFGSPEFATPSQSDVFSVFAGSLQHSAMQPPDDQIARLNAFDEIWVSDESERSGLWKAGIAPERVRVIRRTDYADRLQAFDNRIVPPPIPPAPDATIRVALEGELFAGHSFSNINEHLAGLLSREPSIELSVCRVHHNPTCDRRAVRASELLPFVERELTGPNQIVIRHAFPPNWTPPADGLWVHIQPWEFGKLPMDWIPPLRDRVHEIWAPSNYVKRVYIDSGIDPSKIQVIPWGVDVQTFNPDVPKLRLKTRKQFRFLYVGGTIARKGFDRVLEAFLAEFGPEDDVCLVVKDVGANSFYAPDSHRDKILSEASKGSSPEIIYFDGDFTAGQLASLYSACNCLLLPYRGEGFGLPVLEAMACGLPPVVPRGGPTDDFVTDETGYFLDAEEVENYEIVGLCGTGTEFQVSVDDLRRTMRHAYTNTAETAQKGQQAACAVRESFTWQHSGELVINRIQQLSQRSVEIPGKNHADTLIAPIIVLPNGSVRDLSATLCAASTFSDSIFVLDSTPSDAVVAISQDYMATVIAAPEDARLGRGWVLFLHANEFLTDTFVGSLNEVLNNATPVAKRVAMHVTDCQDRSSYESRFVRVDTIADSPPLNLCDGDEAIPTEARIDRFRKPCMPESVHRSAPEHSANRPDNHRRAVILQLATGAHRELLALTREHHRRYADKHGLEYLCVEHNPAAPKRAGWGKIRMILSALEMGFDRIVWLDADAVIVDENVDLSSLVPAGIGMVRHPNGDGKGRHWNSGVMIVKASDAVRQFLESVDREPENDSPWMEQLPINTLASDNSSAILVELPAALNSTPGAVVADEPVIAAAHGLPFDQRIKLISEWVNSSQRGSELQLPTLNSRDEFGKLLNSFGLVGEAVEIGVLRGEFSRVLLDSWNGTRLHLVDPWRKIATGYVDIHNLPDLEHEECLKQTLKNLAPHAGRFAIHRSLSCETVRNFADDSLDFIYIDANHETSAVLQDLQAWFPKLRKGGILAGHDFLDGELPEGSFGVKSAVTQFAHERRLAICVTQEAVWPSWYCMKPISTPELIR